MSPASRTREGSKARPTWLEFRGSLTAEIGQNRLTVRRASCRRRRFCCERLEKERAQGIGEGTRHEWTENNNNNFCWTDGQGAITSDKAISWPPNHLTCAHALSTDTRRLLPGYASHIHLSRKGCTTFARSCWLSINAYQWRSRRSTAADEHSGHLISHHVATTFKCLLSATDSAKVSTSVPVPARPARHALATAGPHGPLSPRTFLLLPRWSYGHPSTRLKR